MLFLLSPSKGQQLNPLAYPTTPPYFQSQAVELNAILKKMSKKELAEIMKTSPTLTEKTHGLIHSFSLEPQKGSAAIATYSGDAYGNIFPENWTMQQQEYAQQHLLILSGLYGALRPFDRIKPYRLEMGLRLSTPAGETMYKYWGEKLTKYCNNEIVKQGHKAVINLTSTEYGKAIQKKELIAPVIDILFRQRKAGKEKSIAIYAKRARGAFIQYCIEQQINHLSQLEDFSEDGYQFQREASSATSLLFCKELTN